MIGRVAAVAALASLLAAAPASGQDDGVLGELDLFTRGPIPAVWDIPLAIEGGVTVSFRGDAAAGCAITGVCGLEGVVTWTPDSRGRLNVLESGRARRRLAATLQTARSVTTAQVTRRGLDGSIGRCSDARRDEFDADVVVGPSRGPVQVSLPGPGAVSVAGADVLMTRCAGPLELDLAGALPTARLARATLRHGRAALDLRGRRSFSAGGFAGTVDSTITVQLERPIRRRRPRVPRRDRERVRMLTETYAIESVDGRAVTTLAGSPDPAACGPLDACGVTGTITTVPGPPRSGRFTLTAVADAPIRWRDLRAALRRGPRRGVEVFGYGGWGVGPGGGSTTSIQHPDGGPPCNDSGAPTTGVLLLLPRRERLQTQATTYPDAFRCPGPRRPDVLGADEPLAAGRTTMRTLARHRPILRLARDTPFAAGGYTGRTHADLTVRLRRIRVTRRTFRS